MDMDEEGSTGTGTRPRRALFTGVGCVTAGVAAWIAGTWPLTHRRSGTGPDGSGWESKMHEHVGGVDLVQVAYVAGLVLVVVGVVLIARWAVAGRGSGAA